MRFDDPNVLVNHPRDFREDVRWLDHPVPRLCDRID